MSARPLSVIIDELHNKKIISVFKETPRETFTARLDEGGYETVQVPTFITKAEIQSVCN